MTRNRVAVAMVGMLLALPCLAGDLEEGIRLRRLGFTYYHGQGVKQDNQRAVALFEKAAGLGDIESAFNLGKMYEYGMGVEQSDSRAATWYRKGAELGDAESQFNAGVMYYKGQGVAADRAEAAKWWTVAMMKGGKFAEKIRPSVESAQGKLTADEIAEGQRRAAEWIKARQSGK
jgi:TPR repeat protein